MSPSDVEAPPNIFGGKEHGCEGKRGLSARVALSLVPLVITASEKMPASGKRPRIRRRLPLDVSVTAEPAQASIVGTALSRSDNRRHIAKRAAPVAICRPWPPVLGGGCCHLGVATALLGAGGVRATALTPITPIAGAIRLGGAAPRRRPLSGHPRRVRGRAGVPGGGGFASVATSGCLYPD